MPTGTAMLGKGRTPDGLRSRMLSDNAHPGIGCAGKRGAGTKFRRYQIAGSDAVVAELGLGVATLLTAQNLLAIRVSIGVRPDAPDFSITASVPVRFHGGR